MIGYLPSAWNTKITSIAWELIVENGMYLFTSIIVSELIM